MMIITDWEKLCGRCDQCGVKFGTQGGNSWQQPCEHINKINPPQDSITIARMFNRSEGFKNNIVERLITNPMKKRFVEVDLPAGLYKINNKQIGFWKDSIVMFDMVTGESLKAYPIKKGENINGNDSSIN